MAALSPNQLGELLSDPDCPWSPIAHNTKKRRGMSVPLLRHFAETRGYDADDAEAAMDLYIAERGGKRQVLTDPWRRGANLLRRVSGRQPRQEDDIWLIAESEVATGD